MPKAYISEYKGLARLNVDVAQIADESSLVTEYVVDFQSGVTPGQTFNAATAYIRIDVDTTCSIKIGPVAVANTTNKRMSANDREYFALGAGIGQGWRISVVSNT